MNTHPAIRAVLACALLALPMRVPAQHVHDADPSREPVAREPAPARANAHQSHGHAATHADHAAHAESSAGPAQVNEATTPAGARHPHTAPATARPRTPIPPLTAADRAAAVRPDGGHAAHDNGIFHYVAVDRLEGWEGDPGGLAWETHAWIGTDLDRLWLRSEGERRGGRTERASIEALYGRAVAPWWDLLVGVRHDTGPGPARDFAAIGVAGVAPGKFDVAATAYLGTAGQAALRLEVSYDVLLTQRLVLQPLVEINAYRRDDARRGIGSGLSTAEAGLRLRYDITRQFAPYVGWVRERAFGQTAALRHAGGEDGGDARFVAGVRFWF
jgi:copper resistance protein B